MEARPDAHPPNIEPKHLIRNRLDLVSGGGTSRTSPTGHIHHIAAPSPAQHQGGETLSPIGCHLPADPRSTITVHIDQRQGMAFGRQLELHEGMIAPVALPRLFLCGPSYELTIVIGTLTLQGLPSHCELSLFSDHQVLRRRLARYEEQCRQDPMFVYHGCINLVNESVANFHVSPCLTNTSVTIKWLVTSLPPTTANRSMSHNTTAVPSAKRTDSLRIVAFL